MDSKRIFSIAIALSMLAVSFSMVMPQTAKADNLLEGMPVGWNPGEFAPNDVAWNVDGNMCVVVGQYMSGPTTACAWAYFTTNNTWWPLETPNPTTQTLFGVSWDEANLKFWLAGTWAGTAADSSLLWFDGIFVGIPQGLGGYGLLDKPIKAAVANSDGMTIMLVGSDAGFGYFMKYDYASDDYITVPVGGGSLASVSFNTLVYDPDNDMFYAAGNWVTSGAFWYTESGPTFANCWQDQSTLPGTVMGGFVSMDWNPNSMIGLVAGMNSLYMVSNPTGIPGSITMNWYEVTNVPGNTFLDVAWDTDGYTEAAVVGVNNSLPTIWRLYNSFGLVIAYQGGSVSFPCVDYKPPASPKWMFIPAGAGAFKFNVMQQDQTTTITANAVFPKLYWIGFNDTGFVNRMDQQVSADANYWFTMAGSYSEGWLNTEVMVSAWYDGGAVQSASSYATNGGQTRTLAFSVLYDPSVPSTTMIYPTGVPGEFTTAAANDIPLGGLPGDTHIVQIPIYIGPQARFADGSGFGSGDPFFDSDKNIALQDANSWDFSVSLRDSTYITAENVSYGEFGLQELVSVLVSGNPSGNAPPGTIDNPMTQTSAVAYSANTAYWVNVSIPNLYKNGDILSPDWIGAADVSVQNLCPNATALNSDIDAQAYFTGPNTPLYVWGSTLAPITPPNNGTNATGPVISNYNAPIWGEDDFTELMWWVTVQAGTSEGIYWAIITISIES